MFLIFNLLVNNIDPSGKFSLRSKNENISKKTNKSPKKDLKEKEEADPKASKETIEEFIYKGGVSAIYVCLFFGF